MAQLTGSVAIPWGTETRWPRVAALAGWLLSARAIPLGLAVVTFAVFSPALWNDFVQWDDYVNIKDNEHFRGLGWTQIRWMFTAILMGHYIPVTWLTFGMDYVLWGMNPAGYHLTNIVLHSANAGLVYLVALRLLSRALPAPAPLPLCAAVAALFFAVHPLRAESVAWVTERRDVLSGLFTLTTVLLYLRAADAEGRRRVRLLAAAVVTYLLALGSKSIVMTLPFVLMVLDVHPLRRLPSSWRRWGAVELRGVWREKIPFLALGILGAIVSWYAVAANNFFTPAERYPWEARPGLVFYSLAFYAWKTLLPLALTPLYELPLRVDLLAPRFAGSIAAVLIVGLALLALRRRWPAGLAAAVCYGIMIAPIAGVLHAGHQLAHDRYSYLSCLGIALLVGAVPATLLALQRRGAVRPTVTRITIGAVVVWLGALAAMTVHQVQVWKDTESLWRYAIDADDSCSLCHHNLGHALLVEAKAPADAIPHLERAVELRPDRVILLRNLGVAYAGIGHHAAAIEHFDRLLVDRPTSVDMLVEQATFLGAAGRLPEAHERLTRALAIDGRHLPARVNQGVVLTHMGRARDAIDRYLQPAVDEHPESAHARLALGLAWVALGENDRAREQYDTLVTMEAAEVRTLAPMLGAHLIHEW